MSEEAPYEADSAGTRIHQRHVKELESAIKHISGVASSLRQAGCDPAALEACLTQMRVALNAAKTKAFGRVDGRVKYPRRSNRPLLEARPIMQLSIDESGTNVRNSNEVHKIFAVGGVAMTETASAEYVQKADAIKIEFFGHRDITFHEPHMRKRNAPFRFAEARSLEFTEALRGLIAASDFTAFGVVIRKDQLDAYFDGEENAYLPSALYSMAIMMLIERFVDFLAHRAETALGRIIFESQGTRPDAEHQAAFADLLLHGTQWVSPSDFLSWLETGCRFQPKIGSDPTELADLLSRDLFEWGASGCTKEPLYWDQLSPKFHVRGDGYQGRFGVKVFPDNDVREVVLHHRKACGATL